MTMKTEKTIEKLVVSFCKKHQLEITSVRQSALVEALAVYHCTKCKDIIIDRYITEFPQQYQPTFERIKQFEKEECEHDPKFMSVEQHGISVCTTIRRECKYCDD